jgi:inorganic pyrophosphatase-like protein/uncharacterized protein DUF5661
MSAETMLRKDKEGTLFKEAFKDSDLSPGGLADTKKPGDFNPKSLMDGLRVELEHTNNRRLAREIASDHLTEDPQYYKKLQRMEKEAEDYGTNGAGFKLQGKTAVRGIPVDIENQKGSVREGKNEDGSTWRTKFKLPYGYIRGTKGADGEEVDAYVGPDKKSDTAFVVRQKKDDGSYDEDTVMLGFKTKADAKKGILAHYDDPKYVGAVVPVSVEKLKGLVDAKKPLTKISNGDMLEYFMKHPKKLKEYKARHEKTAAPSSLVPAYGSGDVVQVGKPASAKVKPGDVPSRDEPSSYPKTEQTQTNRSTIALTPALDAQKMASMKREIGRLVGRDQFPTVEGDPTNRRDRTIATHITTLAPNPEDKAPSPWEGPI